MWKSGPLANFGQAVGNPWIALDGRLNASDAAIQHPTLLNSYPVATPPNARTSWPNNGTQPPWDVAGVDYSVGPRTSITIKDPFQGLPPSNGNLDPALVAIGGSYGGVTITFNGASATNATISGWDFSGATGTGYGGVGVLINANGMIVTDCIFKVGSVQQVPLEVSNGFTVTGSFTLQYTIIDGSRIIFQPAGSMFICTAGTLLVQYCWFKNSYFQHCEIGCNSPTSVSNTFQYNLFDNSGYGAPEVNFTGYIDNGSGSAGTVLHVASPTSPDGFVINTDNAIFDSGGLIANLTYITGQLSGTAGGAGTYSVNISQKVASAGSQISMNTGGAPGLGGHGDWIMFNGGTPSTDYGAIIGKFNTFVQNEIAALAHSQGYSFGGQAGTVAVSDVFNFSNNTMVVPGGSNVNYSIILDTSLLKNNAVAVISNNYSDATGNLQGGGNWKNIGNDGQGPWNGSAALINNINMPDGTTLT